MPRPAIRDHIISNLYVTFEWGVKVGMSFLCNPFSHLYNLCTYVFQIRRKRAADLYIRLSLTNCVRGFQDYQQIQWFARRPRGSEIIVRIIMVYYSKRIKNKVIKGKWCMGKSLEETRCKLPKVLPQHRIWLISLATRWGNLLEVLSTSEVTWA